MTRCSCALTGELVAMYARRCSDIPFAGSPSRPTERFDAESDYRDILSAFSTRALSFVVGLRRRCARRHARPVIDLSSGLRDNAQRVWNGLSASERRWITSSVGLARDGTIFQWALFRDALISSRP
jgi:hypothetical protein